jgi:hypothetical protein
MDDRRKADSSVATSGEAGAERKARKRHRGVGRQGLAATDHVAPAGDAQGLGREGALSAPDPVPPASHEASAATGGLLDKIPRWLQSLAAMENELRNAAKQGLILRKDAASEHLAQARRHLQEAFNEARGQEPAHGPQTPLRKDGEI